MKPPYDPALASPFRIDWLVEADALTRDDYERAVAEKAEAILRSAKFVHAHQGSAPTDIEVRVWIEAAVAPGCVSITWEPGFHAFGFHILDETLRERLACIVFRDLPCLDAEGSDEELARVLDALTATLQPVPVRVPVVETRPVDPGVER
ncbi:MAG TPA: hypothetical protein VM370_06400 [Candidatus Thermoplasmatota archaeon]|nr:hypothetical protein [Candidatus Thermoplasmatota archaeon]